MHFARKRSYWLFWSQLLMDCGNVENPGHGFWWFFVTRDIQLFKMELDKGSPCQAQILVSLALKPVKSCAVVPSSYGDSKSEFNWRVIGLSLTSDGFPRKFSLTNITDLLSRTLYTCIDICRTRVNRSCTWLYEVYRLETRGSIVL